MEMKIPHPINVTARKKVVALAKVLSGQAADHDFDLLYITENTNIVKPELRA
ncbi:hypothetical protein [Rhizobium sp. PL01]|uniref:hypothetical protein n=1 Tax=Rhizobium sp. PL01 TaxID=3085631 RepID=UPI00298163DD|nr:hypothetical protein [Rhizobium sp. PL01]MDW5316744.1 hypothetical protein [Rhizobium sp. PL01]